MRPPFAIYGASKQDVFMSAQKHQDQGIITLSQTDYLPILIDSFLTDRKAQGFAGETVRFLISVHPNKDCTAR